MSTVEERRGWVDLGLAMADEADAIALRHFRRDLEISTKPDRTFVTQADTAIERQIRERIAAAHPDHGLVGEEYGVEAGSSIRSTAPTTSSGACPCSACCWASRRTASSRPG